MGNQNFINKTVVRTFIDCIIIVFLECLLFVAVNISAVILYSTEFWRHISVIADYIDHQYISFTVLAPSDPAKIQQISQHDSMLI